LLVLVLVSVVAVVIIAAGNLRSDTRALVAYLEEARTSAIEHSAESADFKEQVIAGMQTLDRDRLTTLMTQMAEAAAGVTNRLSEIEVPPAAAAPAAAFSLATASWEAGLSSFEDALLEVIDNPADAVAIGGLADVLVDLEVGDRAYARFVEQANTLRSEADVEIGEFPDVGYLTVALSSLTFAERLAGVASRSEGLTLSRDLAIAAVRLDPESTGGTTDGAPILPNTETLVIQVVVVNEGNRDETDVTVSLVMRNGDGITLEERSSDLPVLDAGGSVTVEFAGLAVTAGEKLAATVSVGLVDGELDTENNLREVPFFVNEPA
jgi:Sec-independent protein translocase protein TatA